MIPFSVEMIPTVRDYPRPGINFIDTTWLTSDSRVFDYCVESMIKLTKDLPLSEVPNKVIGIESRGFIWGAALAHALGISFVPIRKKGKLPRETYQVSYEKEYGSDIMEITKDDINSSDNVIIVDDLLATGGTFKAATQLCAMAKAHVSLLLSIVELENLHGSITLQPYLCKSVLKMNE